jgi:hypothetical protein
MSAMTVEMLRALLSTTVEASEPQTAILAYLRARNGKKLTKADEAKLRAVTGRPEIQMSVRGSMNYIEWGNYTRFNGREGGALLVS